MAGTTIVQGVSVPPFLYGTAWTEDRTRPLVAAALAAGFRGIDTANQRKHYHEAAVGDALEDAGIERAALFLQTKYTYAEGQDARLPFDPRAPYAEQVRQSFASSLEHLRTDRLDSLLLHGPRTGRGLAPSDREVWRAMEELQREGKVGLIGASNMNPSQLGALCDFAEVPPAFLQNRCYAWSGWDRESREVCRERGVVYQGFSLLTANRAELASRPVKTIASRHGKKPSQVIFRFALQVGMICLTGTTDPAHMSEDLAIFDFELSEEEVAVIEGMSG
ncbi:MAG TPA: aldo/keto reductase [Thermoanaerobaculia bacterium]|nr:aldo/keto reductase [Thermoanaerobaculia bacterium]